MAASEARSLYRSLLREARRFPDYNIRGYIARRSQQGFREPKQSKDAAAAALAYGKEQLELVKRQGLVYSLYVPRVKNVMELKLGSSRRSP